MLKNSARNTNNAKNAKRSKSNNNNNNNNNNNINSAKSVNDDPSGPRPAARRRARSGGATRSGCPELGANLPLKNTPPD